MTWFISFDGQSISMFYDKKVCFNRVKKHWSWFEKTKIFNRKKNGKPNKSLFEFLTLQKKGNLKISLVLTNIQYKW